MKTSIETCLRVHLEKSRVIFSAKSFIREGVKVDICEREVDKIISVLRKGNCKITIKILDYL